MRHTVYLSATLAAVWLLNSGHYTPLTISLGIISIALVVWIARLMDVVDQEALPIKLTTKLPGYWLWLIKEVVLANIDVVKRIWSQSASIDPVVATLKITQKTEMGQVVYANSITLTPGTVTLDLHDDEVTVHALNHDALEALRKGEMDRRVTNLEK